MKGSNDTAKREVILVRWACNSLVSNLQKKWHYGLPQLQRNIPTKHNIELNQTILEENNRKILVRIYVREIYNWSTTHDKANSREKSQVWYGCVVYTYYLWISDRHMTP